MPGRVNDYAFEGAKSTPSFTLADLKKQADGDYNMGELLLGTNGKLVHINSKVWKADQNNVVSTGAQNFTVRTAISKVMRDGYGSGNSAAKAVIRYLLKPANSNLPLSRDETRKLLELCEEGKGKNGLDEGKIETRLGLIGKLAKLKRSGLTEEAQDRFDKVLKKADPKDSIGNWVKGLSVVNSGSKGLFAKKIYSSVISKSDNQAESAKRAAFEAQGRKAISGFIKKKSRLLDAKVPAGAFLRNLEEFFGGSAATILTNLSMPKLKAAESRFTSLEFRKGMAGTLKKLLKQELEGELRTCYDRHRKWGPEAEKDLINLDLLGRVCRGAVEKL